MPKYEINGKIIEADNTLSDEEIDEIADSFGSQKGSPVSNASAAPAAAPAYQPGEGLGGAVQGFGGRIVDVAKSLSSPITNITDEIGKAYKGFRAELAGEDSSQYKSDLSDVFPKVFGFKAAKDIAKHSLESAAEQASLIGQEEGLAAKAGRSLLVPLAAFPLTSGSVEAGEKIAAGDTKGYGEAAFDLGTAILPEIPKVIPKIPGAAKAGSWLREGAAKQWGEGLWPKLKYEGLAEKVGAEALEKGLWGRKATLEQAAAENLGLRGPEIENIISSSQKRVNPKAYSLQALEELANSEKIAGVEQGARSLEEAAMGELNRLPEDISLSEAWELRKIKEDPLVRKSAYMGADPQLTAKVEAQGAVADATRNALTEAEPSLQKPMKEYNFYKNLETLLSPKAMKKTPNTALNPFKAQGLMSLVDPYRIMQSIRNSTVYRTGSALLKDRIGKYLESGNIPEAARLAQVELPEELRAPEVWNGIERPINDPRTPMEGLKSQNEVVLDQAQASGFPDVWDGSPEAIILEELDNVGYKPESIPLEQLSPSKIKALEDADMKSLEALKRTINNPTYQALPLEATRYGQKTRASVIREIFLRNRKLALGKKAIE